MVRPANLSTSPETTLKALLWRISTPLTSPYCTDPEKLLCRSFLFVTYHIFTKLVLEKLLMLHWTKCSRWCLPKQKQQSGREWESAQILVARQVLAVPTQTQCQARYSFWRKKQILERKTVCGTISGNGKFVQRRKENGGRCVDSVYLSLTVEPTHQVPLSGRQTRLFSLYMCPC